jgi:hypothetical protein
VRNQAIAVLATALIVGACSGISTSSDYDPAVDFTKYATYTWLDTEGDDIDAITDSRIKSAIDATMVAKGLQKTGANADMAVGYQVTSAERVSYNTVNSGWGGGYGYGGYGWGGYGMGYGMGTSTTYENTWQEGTLLIGMFDVESKNLVWTGTATAALDQSRSPEDRQQLVDDAVSKMMKDFPPGS